MTPEEITAVAEAVVQRLDKRNADRLAYWRRRAKIAEARLVFVRLAEPDLFETLPSSPYDCQKCAYWHGSHCAAFIDDDNADDMPPCNDLPVDEEKIP